jgi:NitT/TauT family transport system permease protein
MSDALRRSAPVVVVLVAVLIVWYGAALALDLPAARALAGNGASAGGLIGAAYSLDRPLLPAPHQIALTLGAGIFGEPVTSPRSLVYHAGVTAVTAVLGLTIALVFGIARSCRGSSRAKRCRCWRSRRWSSWCSATSG